jgi:hypothetical protein
MPGAYGWQYHPVIEWCPRLHGEERTRLFESIKAHGVRKPVEFWTDPAGVCWLIQGRNRAEIAEELGLPADEIPYIEVDWADEIELIDYVEDLDLTRRQMNPGQVACALVAAERMRRQYRRLHADANGTNGHTVPPKTKEFAKAAGTNRDYLFHAEKLYDTRRPVFQQVLRGEKRMGRAMREVFPGKEYRAPVLDGLLRSVPSRFRAVFGLRQRVEAALEAVDNLRHALAEAKREEGGAELDAGRAQDLLTELKAAVMHGLPCTVCYSCQGAGHKRHQRGERCEPCKGRGWTTMEVYDRATVTEKNALAAALGEAHE